VTGGHENDLVGSPPLVLSRGRFRLSPTLERDIITPSLAQGRFGVHEVPRTGSFPAGEEHGDPLSGQLTVLGCGRRRVLLLVRRHPLGCVVVHADSSEEVSYGETLFIYYHTLDG